MPTITLKDRLYKKLCGYMLKNIFLYCVAKNLSFGSLDITMFYVILHNNKECYKGNIHYNHTLFQSH